GKGKDAAGSGVIEACGSRAIGGGVDDGIRAGGRTVCSNNGHKKVAAFQRGEDRVGEEEPDIIVQDGNRRELRYQLRSAGWLHVRGRNAKRAIVINNGIVNDGNGKRYESSIAGECENA